MARILVVEDDKRLNTLISSNLSLVGHACDSLFDGLSVFGRLCEKQYDLKYALGHRNRFFRAGGISAAASERYIPAVFTGSNGLPGDCRRKL